MLPNLDVIGTHMLTEGTGFYPPYPEDKPMAQVTYRGVKYDTDSRKATAPSKSDLTYRGVKHSSKAVAA